MKHRTVHTSIALLLTLGPAAQAVAAPPARSGALDSSFGTNGKVSTDFGGAGDVAQGVALQGDGKLVVAGCTATPGVTAALESCGKTTGGNPGDFALARYNTNGALDPSFGVNGLVTTDFQGLSDGATDVAIQPDSRIVAAGLATTCVAPGQGCALGFALARYDTNGALDPSFGVGGKVFTDPVTAWGAEAWAVTIQGDKIIVAGNACNNPPLVGGCQFDFAVARYLFTGELDPTFGGGGVVLTDFGTGFDLARGLTISGDKILAGGFSDGNFALARYNAADGALDSTFDNDGKVTTDFGSFDGVNDVAVQTDGKIMAAGRSGRNFALARYNAADGSLDVTFGAATGKVTTNFGADEAEARGVTIQGDGKIVAAGRSGGNFALARYNSDGKLDTAFGKSGKVITDFGGSDGVHDVAIQRDKKIVAAGHTSSTGDGDFALALYLP
jgi:uncharacterized delta-60 repeat protein